VRRVVQFLRRLRRLTVGALEVVQLVDIEVFEGADGHGVILRLAGSRLRLTGKWPDEPGATPTWCAILAQTRRGARAFRWSERMQAAGRVMRAAGSYWGAIFALGFVLGTVRVLWIAPAVGLLAATALELPVMLGASWIASGWLVRRFAFARLGEALAAGALAFALLMAAECALAGVATGQSPAQWLAEFAAPHAALGLAGQVVFALMPWWRARG